MSTSASVEQIYSQFAMYPRPRSLWVCEQCGPEWSADDILGTPLRELSLPQLIAVHVMNLDDDTLRYFFPRLMEVLLTTDGPVFDIRMSDLSQRFAGWRPQETAAVRRLAEAVWTELVESHPPALGYFSDCPTALDLLSWCGLRVTDHLDALRLSESPSAALHLADLVDTVCTSNEPFESVSKATVTEWLREPATGERLERAFFATDSAEAAQRMSTAHEMWSVCCR